MAQSYLQPQAEERRDRPPSAPSLEEYGSNLEEYGSNQDRVGLLGPPVHGGTPLLDEAATGMGEMPVDPLPVVQDGTPEQVEIIVQAVDDARESVAAGTALMARGPGAEPGLFEDHFHTTDPALLSCAEEILAATRDGLSGVVPIEVESWDFPWPFPPSIGYVWGGPFRGSSAIHLVPAFFQQGSEDRAGTIVHEAAHKYGGAEDHAYNGTSEYWNLAPELAVENADSFAWFCQLEAARLREEEDEEARREAERAALAHAEAIWRAWQAGELALGKDGFTTPDGVVVPADLVADTVFAWFRDHEPTHFEEVVDWLDANPPAPVTCRDGTVIPEDLVEVVLWHIS